MMNLDWDKYLRGITPDLGEWVRGYVLYRSRSWREEEFLHHTRSLLSGITLFFSSVPPSCLQGITPRVWFIHVEARMKAGIKPASLNTTLRTIQSFLRYVQSNGVEICETMLEVRRLKTGDVLPKDLSLGQVKTLLEAVPGQIDYGWILLMLHSGLRTCEVRSLRWCNVDLQSRTLRIHESKGGKSRVVFLSPQVVQALDYLLRKSEYIFTYRDQPLSRRYCQSRLTTIGEKCGFHVTPHQLRHTCATMLLNAGMSILGVQKLLGHKYVETTLRYARMYDVTVARDSQKAEDKRKRQITYGTLAGV
jgi:integrase